MVNVTELRPGNYFIDEGNLYQVLDILLNKTAMRKMVAKVKVKNVRTGTINELARNSGYMVENVRLDKRQMQYLYDSGDFLVFMDQDKPRLPDTYKTKRTREMQRRSQRRTRGLHISNKKTKQRNRLNSTLPRRMTLSTHTAIYVIQTARAIKSPHT